MSRAAVRVGNTIGIARHSTKAVQIVLEFWYDDKQTGTTFAQKQIYAHCALFSLSDIDMECAKVQPLKVVFRVSLTR